MLATVLPGGTGALAAARYDAPPGPGPGRSALAPARLRRDPVQDDAEMVAVGGQQVRVAGQRLLGPRSAAGPAMPAK